MKHINVPAQITTVEDRIAGNLTLTQLSLVAAPIFINFIFYAALPKAMHLNPYKLPIMFLTVLIFFILAIRFKSKIILNWLITLAKFKFRSRLYVFNKNSLYLRRELDPKSDEIYEPSTQTKARPIIKPIVSRNDAKLKLNGANLNPNFIKERKGRLYVYVNETN